MPANATGKISATWAVLLATACLLLTTPGVGHAKIPFEVLVDTNDAFAMQTSQLLVVRSRSEFDALWSKLGYAGSPPEVDFRRRTVLACFLGWRGYGGYDLAIGGVSAHAGALILHAREFAPAAHCGGGSATMIAPAIMISTVRLPGEGELDLKVERCDCGR